MNPRNKILTKEEINKIAEQKMETILSKYPKSDHSILIRFHNEASEINLWISDKLRKLNQK